MSLSSSHSANRRHFLESVMATLGAIVANRTDVFSQDQVGTLTRYLADVDGDGLVGQLDREIAERALYAQRGFDLVPATGFDQRLDVFGRGVIDRDTVQIVLEAIEVFRATNGTGVEPRPVPIAWNKQRFI